MLYLTAGTPTFAHASMHLCEVVHVLLPLRILAEHDGRPLLAVDVAGGQERQGDDVELDAVRLAQLSRCAASSASVQ